MDLDALQPLSRIPAILVLSRLLRAVFRRRSLRHERSVGAHSRALAAAYVPQLVSPRLSSYVRRFPSGEMIASAAIADPRAAFLRDVADGLSKEPQRELSCQYYYDEIGS